MTNITNHKLNLLLSVNKGYATTSELLKIGLDSREIKKLINKNIILKIKTGLYKQSNSDEITELTEVCNIVPNGVLCLFSALSYYNLTTYNPFEFNMAIHRDSTKPTLPEYPPIKFFYYSDINFNTGITLISNDEVKIKIYDIEKTICDCCRYRNKLGIDIFKESLKEYLLRKDRNLEKLIKYSEILNIKTILKPYLEALTWMKTKIYLHQ